METPINQENIKYPEIAGGLEKMVDEDQASRQRSLENGGLVDADDENLDFDNTERMKEIIKQIGWPTVSKVGPDGAHSAWLLVQHADHDVSFQKECLDLMKDESDGEVDRIDVAYLEDRVRVNEDMPQLYGTQMHEIDGKHEPRPIEDPDKVDERRKEIGMESLNEYRQKFLDKYKIIE